MHEVYNNMTVQDLAGILFNTETGLRGIAEDLHATEIGDYYDAFIEETCELLCYLFTNFKRD